MNITTCWTAGGMATLLGVLAAFQTMAAEPSASNARAFPHSPVTINDHPTPRQSDAPPAPVKETPPATEESAGVVPSQPVPLAATPGVAGPTVPPIGIGPIPPRLPPPTIGFQYILLPGAGYKIVSVAPFSAAARMCLDYGDVILAINGCPMTHYGADIPVRAKAAATDGWLTAYVFERYTGLLVTRTANLFGPAAPPPAAGPTPIIPGPAMPVPGIPGQPPPAPVPPAPNAKEAAPPTDERSAPKAKEKPAQPAPGEPKEKPSQRPEAEPPAPAPPAPPVETEPAPSSKERPETRREPPPAKA